MRVFAKAIALFSAGSLFGAVTQVVKGKIGAIVLQPEGVGVLNQLTNAWNLVRAFSGLGLYTGVVQRIAEAVAEDDNEKLASQFSSSLLILSAFSCLSAFVCVLVSPHFSNWIFSDQGERAGLVAIVLISIPLSVTAQTYKGLLTGNRLVKPIVAAQVSSDLVGLAVFVALVLNQGLLGAALAFSILHGLKLIAQIWFTSTHFKRHSVVPSWRQFRWAEIRINIGYGINGLCLTAITSATLLMVSRWIIQEEGLQGNGVFSVAWKVSSVYFATLYASAGSYYYPTLVACETNDALSLAINEALILYFYLIPPIVALLMVGGDLLVGLLFSKDFLAAGLLLALVLPGNVFKIVADTVGLPFLARRRLLPYTLSYVLWALSYTGITLFCLPRYGLVGVAAAFLISQVLNVVLLACCARRLFAFRFSPLSLRVVFIGFTLVALSASVAVSVAPIGLRIGLGCALCVVWVAACWRESGFRDLVGLAWGRVSRLFR